MADGLLVRRGFEPDLDVTTLFEDAVRSLIPPETLRRRHARSGRFGAFVRTVPGSVGSAAG